MDSPVAVLVTWSILTCVQGQLMTLKGRDYDHEEFCDSEKFQAECMDDEVVVITHAKYGRHRVGKCVAKDYGNLGCVSDVIYAVDSLCSGLQRCEFEVDDDTFASYHPCPKDFKAHLLVAYQCVRVHKPTQSCRGPMMSTSEARNLMTINLLENPLETRYLSSDVTRLTGCGATGFPWILQAPGNQRIALSVVDFSLNGTKEDTSDASRYTLENGVCLVYASVRDGLDNSGGQQRSSTICGRLRPRIRHQFTSSTNHIEIRILQSDIGSPSNSMIERKPRFLLQYQLIGCGDPVMPRGGWIRRLGETSAVGGCDDRPDVVRWRLTCDGNVWNGEIRNCTGEDSQFLEQFVKSVKGLPFGLSVALVVAIAFVVSCFILLIGICFITRRNQNKRRQQEMQQIMPYAQTEAGQQPIITADTKSSKYHIIKSNQSDNMYTDSDVVSKADVTSGVVDMYTLRTEDEGEKYSGYRRQSLRSTDYYPTSEHIYEYPSPEKIGIDPYGRRAQIAHYFDIDPSQGGLGQSGQPGEMGVPSSREMMSRPCGGALVRTPGTTSTGTGSHATSTTEDI